MEAYCCCFLLLAWPFFLLLSRLRHMMLVYFHLPGGEGQGHVPRVHVPRVGGLLGAVGGDRTSLPNCLLLLTSGTLLLMPFVRITCRYMYLELDPVCNLPASTELP